MPTDAGEKDIPDRIDDFGFYYPVEYVKLVAFVLERSGFSVWPDGNALNDQDMRLIEDMMLWFRLRDWEEWKSKHNYEENIIINDDDPTVMRLG